MKFAEPFQTVFFSNIIISNKCVHLQIVLATLALAGATPQHFVADTPEVQFRVTVEWSLLFWKIK